MREDDEVFQRVLGVIGGIGDVRGSMCGVDMMVVG